MYNSKFIGLFLCLYFSILVSSNGSNTCDSNKPREERNVNDDKLANNLPSDGVKCPTSMSRIINLVNIESSDCENKRILSKQNNKLFFIESSEKNCLTPRYACAIESAVKNTELSGYIIVVMTSPYLDISSNNATCHLYTKHHGKNIFFRYANLDTIFDGTPIHQIHLHGHLKHQKEIVTAVQYR